MILGKLLLLGSLEFRFGFFRTLVCGFDFNSEGANSLEIERSEEKMSAEERMGSQRKGRMGRGKE